MSRRPWSPLLLRLLERRPDEIERRAAGFAIRGEAGRELVARLGAAFLGGYHTMLRADGTAQVAETGAGIQPHFRPFFFEGAAMGYLPRGFLTGTESRQRAERDLLAMHPGFRYLYYVSLGFWFGMRHPRHPAALERLAPHLDPMYVPLCYDGFGFKVGFFDYPRRPDRARGILERCPAQHRSAMEQGFGRSLFFVFMDDPDGFRRERDAARPEHRMDRELGRSLAVAFTGANRLGAVAEHVAASAGDEELGARLTGVTWALTAREMNDPAYFRSCLASASETWRDLFASLPGRCHRALAEASCYRDWQERTRAAATEAYRDARPRDARRGTGS